MTFARISTLQKLREAVDREPFLNRDARALRAALMHQLDSRQSIWQALMKTTSEPCVPLKLRREFVTRTLVVLAYDDPRFVDTLINCWKTESSHEFCQWLESFTDTFDTRSLEPLLRVLLLSVPTSRDAMLQSAFYAVAYALHEQSSSGDMTPDDWLNSLDDYDLHYLDVPQGLCEVQRVLASCIDDYGVWASPKVVSCVK